MKPGRRTSPPPESTVHPVILEIAGLLGIMLYGESQCGPADAGNQGANAADDKPQGQARGDLRPL
jgi:hypothetical protein